MATREEKIKVSILGAAEGARDIDRLGKATDRLGDEFAEAARDAKKLDARLDELKASQRELAAEFAKTGDADVGKKLRAVTAQITTATAARKALVGDIEDALDEADRNAERRAKEESKRADEALREAQRNAERRTRIEERREREESRRREKSLRDAQRHFQQVAAAAEKAQQNLRRIAGRVGGGLAGGLLGGVRGGGSAAATLGGGASLAGPAVSGLVAAGKGVAAIGQALATLPPLLATLPALAGGFALVSGTVRMAGPAMGKALMPVADAFKGIQGRVGELASAGLPKLGREFVKVNFPAIRKAMFEIAKDMNDVVRVTGMWVNSKDGQQAIRQITEATADATEKLDGRLARVAVAFGEMVKRIGGGVIGKVADQMVRLAEATIRWMDSIDQSDIDEATKSLSGWGQKLRDTFVALRDVGKWMADNEDKVKKFSDTVATTAIVLGAATGNWLAVLAGSTSLAINHWEDLKKTFADDGPIRKAFKAFKEDAGVRGIWDSMKESWQGAVDLFKKGTKDIGPKVEEMLKRWREAWDEWAPIIEAWWEGVGKPIFSALGTFAAVNLEIFVRFLDESAERLDFLGEALKLLWRVFSEIIGNMVNGAAIAFGWIPGLGPKLEKAAKDFNAFKDRVNAALDGIEDEVVNITYRQQGRAVPVSSQFQSGIGGRASGGPVAAGETYMVGERGPELVTFGRNGYVHNAGDTASMMGGGTVRHVLDLRLNGRAIREMILDDASNRGQSVSAYLGVA